MKTNWRNICKVGTAIATIAAFDGALMGYLNPSLVISLLWCIPTGFIVGILAIRKWNIFDAELSGGSRPL